MLFMLGYAINVYVYIMLYYGKIQGLNLGVRGGRLTEFKFSHR